MSTKTRVLNVRVVGFSAPERQMLNSIFLLSVAPARQIGYKLWNPEAGVAPDMYLLDGDSESAVASWQATFSSTSERTLVVGSKNLDLGVSSASRPLGLKVVGAMDRLAIALQNVAESAGLDVSAPSVNTLLSGSAPAAKPDASLPAAKPESATPRPSPAATSQQPTLSASMNSPAPATGAAASVTMNANSASAISSSATAAGGKLTSAAAAATLSSNAAASTMAGTTLAGAATMAGTTLAGASTMAGATLNSAAATATAAAPMTAAAPAATVLPHVTVQPNVVPALDEKAVTDRTVDKILTDSAPPKADRTMEQPALPPISGATPLSPSALAAAVAPSTTRTNLRAVPPLAPPPQPLAASLPAAARIPDVPLVPPPTVTPTTSTTASHPVPSVTPVAPVNVPTPRHEEHNFRVLAVDDSPLMRTFLQNKLAPYGINPEFAASGEEALFKISKEHYDLIFLDVMLPGMDGYDVCKMIKKNKDNHLMKVVMLTSKDKTFDKIRGTMAGCDGYLTKPVDELKLRAIIERHTVSRK